jgi:hypothetical protein
MDAQYASNAVLVTLSIKTWAANAMDRDITSKVASEHGTDVKLARVWKTLVPNKKGSDLGNIYAIEREARNFHYENTLPYKLEGQRILPTKNYARYMEKFRQLKEQLELAVLKFLQSFEEIKMRARTELKGMYREEDYPTLERLIRAFDISVSTDPLPNSATFFQTQLPETELVRMKSELESQLHDTFRKANEELWDRMASMLKNMKERLNGDKKMLRENAIENLNNLLDLLPRLNVNNDQKLEELRQQMKSSFAGLTAASLRQDDNMREQKVAEVEQMQSTMAAYMGLGFGAPGDVMEMKSAA